MVHSTDIAFAKTLALHTGHIQVGLGPGLGSIPAISNKILTSPAGIGWSVSRKIHKVTDLMSSERSRVEDFAGLLVLLLSR